MTISELIQNKQFDKANPVSEETLTKFEDELSLKFGSQFRSYLKEFGALTVEHYEFYGICGSNNSIPSAIHATKQSRKYSPQFPKNLIVFSERGDGVLYVVNEDDQVYLYDGGELTDIQQSFNDFVIGMIENIK